MTAVRGEIGEYFDRAHPSLAAAREAIERALDDTRMVLSLKPMNAFWLAFAAQQLASAEAQFMNARGLIEQHGGPGRDQLTRP